MSDLKGSTKATILFDGPVGLDFVELINELQRPFRNIALEFDETAVAPGSHALFISERMIVRVGYGPSEFAPDMLRSVKRPGKQKVGGAVIDALVEQVSRSVIVSVEEGPGRSTPERIRVAACYHVVRHLLRHYEASLVHWHHSDTLFTADEFENPVITGDGGAIPRRPERNATRPVARPKMGFAEPARPFAAVHMEVSQTHDRLDQNFARVVNNSIEEDQRAREDHSDLARDEARLRRARQTIFAGDLIETKDEIRSQPPEKIGLMEQLSVYVMTITIMVLSFPVGFALLVYTVLRGENLKVTARAMALTGIGVGVTSAEFGQVLSLLV